MEGTVAAVTSVEEIVEYRPSLGKRSASPKQMARRLT